MLQDRCRILGLPAWRFDAAGRRLSGPSDIGAAGAWLRCEAVEGAIADAVNGWVSGIPPSVVEIADGFWVIPLLESSRRKRTAYIVAGVLGPTLFDTEFFERACRAVPIGRSEARQALAPFAVYSRQTAGRLAVCLGWSYADLEAIGQGQATLEGFSRQLADSFEEITLLQKLGRSMNQLANPRKFLVLACEELLKTLPFEWVAVRFRNDPRLARTMSEPLHVFGEPPCGVAELEACTGRMLRSLRPGESRVIDRNDLGLAGALAGRKGASQVVVSPVAVASGGGEEDSLVAAIFAGGKRGEDPQVSSTDIKLLDSASSYLSILLDNAFLYDAHHRMFVGTLEAMTSAIDAKDPYTCGHSERVAEVSGLLAAAYGLPGEQVERVRLAGIVHDVGKIGVPEAVLCKTGRLTEEEFDLIRLHPEIGYRILRDIPQFEDLLPGVLYHHERFDGRGYPRGLLGPDIPLMARIIGLVDAFDAMSSNRTYRSAMPRERVFEELHENARKQFDPDLVEAFNGVDLSRYDELVVKHQAVSAEGGLRTRRRWLAA